MKRGKTALLLMEQLIMLLVFALAAALCLQAFVSADRISRSLEARDRASELAQSAAETLRHTGGDFPRAGQLLAAAITDQGSFTLALSENWSSAEDEPRYTLTAQRQDSGLPGLGKAQIWVRDEAEDEELLRLDIAWQEVDAP